MNNRRLFFVTLAAVIVIAAIGIRWLPQPETDTSAQKPSARQQVAHGEGNFREATSQKADKPNASLEDESQTPLATELVSIADTKRGPKATVANGFVGSSSCRECHADAHTSWHASYHRTMTQEVNEKTAPASINNQKVIVDGKTYLFENMGEYFDVVFDDPLVGNQTRRRRLVLMTGSHHMNVFWYESDVHGTPGQLDIVFLKDEQRWIPRDSSFLRPDAHSTVLELGTWNRTCSRCHATHPTEGYNETNKDWNTQVAEFGIACESCHGEGAGHVARYSVDAGFAKEANTAEKQAAAQDQALARADKIVNPSKLAKQESADVCGQCHSIFIPNYQVISEADYMREGNPFRPGESLSGDGFIQVVRATPEFRKTETFKQWASMETLGSGFWSDGTPRIAGREYNGMIESPCFERGEMTCLSCHTMHPSKDQDLTAWRDDQLKPGMHGDQACLQCHQEYQDKISAHTHHSIQSEGSRCMNCHMPHTTYGLLKTIRSHQISSPSIQTSKTSDRPDACSLCHLDQSFDWVSGYLSDWYGQPKSEQRLEEGSQPVATSVLHLLSGDAAQRAVQVAAMGRQAAQDASGTDWIEPFLILGLNDPYDAIRLVAARSLKTLPNRKGVEVDPLAPDEERMQAFNESILKIDEEANARPRSTVLVDPKGHFDFPRVKFLLDRRNHSPIYLRE